MKRFILLLLACVFVFGTVTTYAAPSIKGLAVYINKAANKDESETRDLPEICRNAEILVVAAGKAKLVGADFAAPGQVVIDVGIHVTPGGTLCGDVDLAAVEPVVEAITPVPGGVGSVTTAVLAKHVVEAAERTVE